MPAGRPKEYSEEIVAKTRQYLDSCFDFSSDPETKIRAVNIPTIEGLAVWLKIHRDTIYAWEKEHPQFSDIIAELRSKQANALINNGLSGNYNPTIAKVLLTKHGYREGIDQTTNDKDLPRDTVTDLDLLAEKMAEKLKEEKL